MEIPDLVVLGGNKEVPSNFTVIYNTHQISKLKCFSSRHAVVFAQSIEARC